MLFAQIAVLVESAQFVNSPAKQLLPYRQKNESVGIMTALKSK
jgi:hypothetical protein